MKRTILLALFVLSIIGVAANDPPSLTDFMQVYGEIDNLPEGQQFTLKARVSNKEFSTLVAADGKYGQSQSFKIGGTPGDEITFVLVDALGKEVELGIEEYQHNEIEEINFEFGVHGRVNNEDNGNGVSNSNSNSNNNNNNGDSSAVEDPNKCRQSWTCGDWSQCITGKQTTTCRDMNSCVQKLAAGEIEEIIEIPKPAETRSCTNPVAKAPSQAIPSNQVCSPNAKRCDGNTLQRCAVDGSKWDFEQSCSEGCNPVSLRCITSGATAVPNAPKSSFPVWLLPLVGVVVLLVIIGTITFAIIRKKKYGPLKEYIAMARGQGFEDHQIRSRLLDEGWDPKQIDKNLG